MIRKTSLFLLLLFGLSSFAASAIAQPSGAFTPTTTVRDADSIGKATASSGSNTIKITPIGQRTGEYCARDRAMLFEDQTDIRILYDPGITVSGDGPTAARPPRQQVTSKRRRP